MNMKQPFLIFCLGFIFSLSAKIEVTEDFFDSLMTHPTLVDLEWNLITESTKDVFFYSLLQRASLLGMDINSLNIKEPKTFFDQFRFIHKSTTHLFPEPRLSFIEEWFSIHNDLQTNINLMIQLLSINPKYASFFLTKKCTAFSDFGVDHPLVIVFSLLAGGDPNERGSNDQNPLSLICSLYAQGASEKSVELLLLAGALPNIKTGILGETALHHAAYIKNRCIIHSLLDAGADCMIKNKKGQTPRDLILMSQRFPHVNLTGSSVQVRRSFEFNQINDKTSFRLYCSEIADDFQVEAAVRLIQTIGR
jgi:hypothetical protein